MASQFEEVDVGPFIGGLNTLSDQTSISDTELFQCMNFELDQDGSLVSRPPIRLASPIAIPGTNKAVDILGYFVDSSTQAVYLIAGNRAGATYYYANGNWTLITNTFSASACTQFRDKLYLVAPLTSANPGGTWAPGVGFVADATQPKGACIVSNKERLWIAQGKNATANGSRVYVTDIDASGVTTWAGNFIPVSTGDGQNIVDIAVYNSDLVIFKQSSTYRFSFGSEVKSGYVSPISTTVGANDTGCYTVWEQQIYVVFNNAMYEFTNYIFNQLNVTVPLIATNPAANLTKPISISAWSNRIFVSYFNTVFVYNLRNRTWSQWSSDKVISFGRFFPFPFQQAERPLAFLNSSQPVSASEPGAFIYQVVDVIEPGLITDPAVSELFTCTLETKNYDYQSQSKWKRLSWWGADVLSRANIRVYAQPVQYANSITWGEAKLRTWGAAKLTTWGRPSDKSIIQADSVDISGLQQGRKFIKFLKSLRFRQISFKLQADTHGTQTDAPVHVYALSTYVREKQLVAKKVN